jgi:hypothetical protein
MMEVITTVGIANSVWNLDMPRKAKITTSKEGENTILTINDYERDREIIFVLDKSELKDLLGAIAVVNT